MTDTQLIALRDTVTMLVHVQDGVTFNGRSQRALADNIKAALDHIQALGTALAYHHTIVAGFRGALAHGLAVYRLNMPPQMNATLDSLVEMAGKLQTRGLPESAQRMATIGMEHQQMYAQIVQILKWVGQPATAEIACTKAAPIVRAQLQDHHRLLTEARAMVKELNDALEEKERTCTQLRETLRASRGGAP